MSALHCPSQVSFTGYLEHTSQNKNPNVPIWPPSLGSSYAASNFDFSGLFLSLQPAGAEQDVGVRSSDTAGYTVTPLKDLCSCVAGTNYVVS